MTVRKRYYRLGKYAITPPLVDKMSRSHIGPTWPDVGERTNAGTRRRNGAGTAFGGNGSKAEMEERMSKKLPEAERTPGGGLPRMTPAQRRRATALIRKTCCNYENGNCLLLDDGEECVCPQTISYSVCCKWFRWAVLPQDKALEAEIFRSASVKR